MPDLCYFIFHPSPSIPSRAIPIHCTQAAINNVPLAAGGRTRADVISDILSGGVCVRESSLRSLPCKKTSFFFIAL